MCLVIFTPFCTRHTIFVVSCLLNFTPRFSESEKESTVKGKKLLPLGRSFSERPVGLEFHAVKSVSLP